MATRHRARGRVEALQLITTEVKAKSKGLREKLRELCEVV